ncbi:hypothetical protein COW82_00945 [Candidatus Campbellbacteria bacterium CG22_combo_CG10-13_8_21_14_all_43_18]|uniref:SHS2 domain-containing protein n=1 Tax=Candidatus Campbellbacteria bacterium CG22_combo_CG10-13_8_21_14_all_43_18 TaxID=1974530 RepID=A0A2H0DWV0_9BACT|nr:MAG: hypothetical protein COW82_00945 [Candidatus Campbellbacteria bacterium CG22_combo_CG10-13_8_21_14_all_43_18]
MLINSLLKMEKIFLKFLPPPKLLRMSHAALNFSDHSVKILELFGYENEFSIKKFGAEIIPDGVIKSGNINNRDSLKEILKKVKEKYDLSLVGATLPEEKAYVFKLRVPKSNSEKEIRNSIEFQMEDNVPISVNEALFDYKIIPKSERVNSIDVGVSVLPQKVVASYISLFKDVGMTPVFLEIEAESIARAVIAKDDMDTYMIVDYGRTRTGFSVVSRGVIRYTSTAEIGGEPIDKILEEKFHIKKEEVEKIKNEKGLVRDKDKPELYMSLANVVSVLKDEINKRFIFWHTHKDIDGKIGDNIKKIILVGGNANLFGLKDYLQAGLKVRVEYADVWKNVKFRDDAVPVINFQNSLSYSSSVGVCLKKFNEK